MNTHACRHTILPHPNPLPLGEGMPQSALSLPLALPAVTDPKSIKEGAKRSSLSQRERAGVREKRTFERSRSIL